MEKRQSCKYIRLRKALSVYEESDAFAKLVTISGAGHIFFNAKHREQAISDILGFLKPDE